MKRPYQITAVVALLFAVFVAWESVELRLYLPMGPGPGFFPLWLSVGFGLLAVIMFCHATFAVADPMPEDFFPTRRGWLRMAAIMGALGAALVLFEPLGFRLTMFAFFMFLLNALSRHRLVLTTVIAVAGSFGVYHVFKDFLEIPLPVGVFGI